VIDLGDNHRKEAIWRIRL